MNDFVAMPLRLRAGKSCVPATCASCEFSFSEVPELGVYVCDKDGNGIELDKPPRKSCPLRPTPAITHGLPCCARCGGYSWCWDFVKMSRACRDCAAVVAILVEVAS